MLVICKAQFFNWVLITKGYYVMQWNLFSTNCGNKLANNLIKKISWMVEQSFWCQCSLYIVTYWEQACQLYARQFSTWKFFHCIHNSGHVSYFYRNGDAQTVLIIKDTEGSIYGAYASQPWEKHSDFYGDMKTFLFKLYPEASIFRPTGANKNLQWVCLCLCSLVFIYFMYCHLPSPKQKWCRNYFTWLLILTVCYELHLWEYSEWYRLWRQASSLWPFPICWFRSRALIYLQHIHRSSPFQHKQVQARSNWMLGDTSEGITWWKTRARQGYSSWEIQGGPEHAEADRYGECKWLITGQSE